VLSSIKKLIEGFMTSRERVIRAIEFTNPDRVPLSHGILPAAWYAYGEKLRKIVEKYPRDLCEDNPTSPKWHPWDSFLNKMSWNVEDDFAGVGPRGFEYGTKEIGNSSDEWGCIWRKIEPGITGQVIKHPLEKWEEIKNYRFRDPLAYWHQYILPKGKPKEVEEYVKYVFNLFVRREGGFIFRGWIIKTASTPYK